MLQNAENQIMNLDTYCYIVVRNNLSPEQICVQASHAAIEMTKSLMTKETPHPNLVVCMVKSEAKLEALARSLEEKGIDFRPFYDSDDGNGMTALATAPIIGEPRLLFKKYMLLKLEKSSKENDKQ